MLRSMLLPSKLLSCKLNSTHSLQQTLLQSFLLPFMHVEQISKSHKCLAKQPNNYSTNGLQAACL